MCMCPYMSWCFSYGSLQVAFKNWWLPDVIIKVFPIRLLNVLGVNHLARGAVWLHECGTLVDVKMWHVDVDVVEMGYQPSDSII
jgi:hypothetical protein